MTTPWPGAYQTARGQMTITKLSDAEDPYALQQVP
jgi:hypothetical protein